MTILFYHRSTTPTPEEAQQMQALAAEDHRVLHRNVQAWHGETERADAVVSHRADVLSAYEKAGVPIYGLAVDEAGVKSTDFTVSALEKWLAENEAPPGFWEGEDRKTALALKEG